jgi:hypothetical protein
MLFDLRGRGRRTTIKVIYVALALLMGGGLVLFGIGGDTSGGLVDAITGSSGGDTGEKRFEQKVTAAEAKVRANPSDRVALQDLVRARVSLAGTGNRYDQNADTYSEEGKRILRQAGTDWEKLLALSPPQDDELSRVASLMVRTYATVNDFSKATRAQEIVAESRESAGAYSQLAILAYQANQTRKGDLAAKKALDLTDKDMRETLKAQLDQAKQQAVLGQVQSQTQGSGSG